MQYFNLSRPHATIQILEPCTCVLHSYLKCHSSRCDTPTISDPTGLHDHPRHGDQPRDGNPVLLLRQDCEPREDTGALEQA
jgi:hypothetical protein